MDDDIIIGLKLEQAIIKMVDQGLTVRVTFRDSQALIVTRDYVHTRINVAVINGIVSAVLGRG